MLTQMDLIEAARAAITRLENRPETVSYYRVSKELAVTSAYISQLREGRAIMSSAVAFKLAQLAEINPTYAMASIEAERAARDGSETSGTWRALAETLAGKAAGILLAACLAWSPSEQAQAVDSPAVSRPAAPSLLPNNVYYGKPGMWRRLMERFSRWFPVPPLMPAAVPAM